MNYWEKSMKYFILILLATIVANAQQISFEKEFEFEFPTQIDDLQFIKGENPACITYFHDDIAGTYLRLMYFNKEYTEIIKTESIPIPTNYIFSSLELKYINSELYLFALGSDDKPIPNSSELFIWKCSPENNAEMVKGSGENSVKGLQSRMCVVNNSIFVYSNFLSFSANNINDLIFKFDKDLNLLTQDTLKNYYDDFVITSEFLISNESRIYTIGKLNNIYNGASKFGILSFDENISSFSVDSFNIDTLTVPRSIKDPMITNGRLYFGKTHQFNEIPHVKDRKTFVFSFSKYDIENDELSSFIFRKDTVNQLSGISQTTDGNIFLYGTTGNYYEEFNEFKLREFQNYIVKFSSESDKILWEYKFGSEKFYDNILHIEPLENNRYLLLTNRNDTKLTVMILEDIPSSVKNYTSQNNLKIYPNPAGIHLYIENDLPIKNLKVTNIYGVDIPVQYTDYDTHVEIKTENLTPSIYFVQIQTLNGKIIKKFIKK